jgi:hypothetical protein
MHAHYMLFTDYPHFFTLKPLCYFYIFYGSVKQDTFLIITEQKAEFLLNNVYIPLIHPIHGQQDYSYI